MAPDPADPQFRSQRFEAVLDAALDCIICMDREGKVLEWNPAAEKTFGYRRGDVLGRELASFIIPPELRDRHRAGLAHFLVTGEGPVLGRRIELPAIRADGAQLVVELAITVIRSGDAPFFAAYLRDLTEQMRAEQRRTAQYEIARILSGECDVAGIGPAVLPAIARVGRWVLGILWMYEPATNDLSLASHWLSAPEFLPFVEASTDRRFLPGAGLPGRVLQTGQPAWISHVQLDPDFLRVDAATRSGLRGAFAFPLLHGAQLIGVVELFSIFVEAPDEDLLQLVGAVGSSIAQCIVRQRAEQELNRRKAEAEEQRRIAEAANVAKDRFLAVLSHELRTPLSPILFSLVELEQRKDFSPEEQSALATIRRNAELEARLIDDLLDLTRISRSKLEQHLAILNAHEIIAYALGTSAADIAARQLHVIEDLAAATPFVEADATRLQQVFWNLVRNAVKFTPSGGTIWVRTRNLADGSFQASVQDTGIGIPPASLAHIFQPFVQGNSATHQQFGGLGLGLAIARALVAAVGGSLVAESPGEGRGATFTVTLPTATARPAPVATTAAPVPISAVARPARLLLIDDHADTQHTLRRLLQKRGYTVEVAATVADALRLGCQCSFDLIVSDIGLPDGTGYDIMRALRRDCCGIGIAISGFGMEADLAASADAGFSRHLTKPVDFAELLRCIEELLPQP